MKRPVNCSLIDSIWDSGAATTLSELEIRQTILERCCVVLARGA
jgi:hypothetical protein